MPMTCACGKCVKPDGTLKEKPMKDITDCPRCNGTGKVEKCICKIEIDEYVGEITSVNPKCKAMEHGTKWSGEKGD